ncbi:hypothetical protein CGGC5_v011242 [Colletotrichum fructicola Nara gc5]|uniref:Uncharacterized protein n=1 Tax=Colletotrichum fructicola (strain Nara gc5) TaxID=1213859 RepID=A0A7J6IY24_COLFN|nr:hypothetical protein CGGC5_v011242 [Colletotrichum fructicola Nara gc5]KAF5488457.1 hypothetical protein CGCF413_v012771 [Colletotrichum fructicola]
MRPSDIPAAAQLLLSCRTPLGRSIQHLRTHRLNLCRPAETFLVATFRCTKIRKPESIVLILFMPTAVRSDTALSA